MLATESETVTLPSLFVLLDVEVVDPAAVEADLDDEAELLGTLDVVPVFPASLVLDVSDDVPTLVVDVPLVDVDVPLVDEAVPPDVEVVSVAFVVDVALVASVLGAAPALVSFDADDVPVEDAPVEDPAVDAAPVWVVLVVSAFAVDVALASVASSGFAFGVAVPSIVIPGFDRLELRVCLAMASVQGWCRAARVA